MKKILLAVLLLSSFCFAAKVPVPAEYDQHMTVVSTRFVFNGNTCSNEVTILKNSGDITLSGECRKTAAGNYGLLPGVLRIVWIARHTQLGSRYGVIFAVS